jgi:predicted nuclease with TOPRIM domain
MTMVKNDGFSKTQINELKKLFTDSFVENFNDILLPSLDKMSEDLGDLKKRIKSLEDKVTVMDEKLDGLRIELADIRRRLTDLENDTPTMTSIMSLKNRVVILEKKLGISLT